MTSQPDPPTVRVGGAQIHAQNVQLRSDLIIDEIHLEGGDIVVEPPGSDGSQPHISTGETRIRAMMTEPNLNRVLEANVPPEAPVKHLRIAVLTGKIRLSMSTVGLLSLPLSLDAVPRIDNGTRVMLDWQGIAAGGIALPHQLVEIIEQKLNKTLDLGISPIPIWLDEIHCEPGRLTVIGKARVSWPPPVLATAAAPFTAREFPATEAALDLPPGPTSIE